MKRILFFLLLLVNLHLTTDNGSLSIGLGEVVAQRVQEERLSKVTTRGWGDQWTCPNCRNTFYDYSDKNIQDHLYYECDALNTTCPQCHDRVQTDALGWHMNNECRCRKVQCPTCYEVCYAYEIEWGSHICSQPCMFCGRDVKFGEFCNCPGAIADGHKPWWMSGGIGFDDDDIFDPNNDGGGIGGGPFTYDMSGFSISIRDLKRKQGVKLVSQTKLPDQLHPQTLVAECVIRAYAFMAQLKGYDYETAYATLSNIAFNAGYDLERLDGGIDCDQLQKLFKSYAIIAAGPNTPENVAQFIDRGIPVALVTEEIINGKKYKHMVTVIGYDGKYYYTAAGYPNGMATIYDKKECEKISQLFIVDNIKTPFKSPKK